jgi:drug/metabolite transporter (DMT)-like permease
LLVLMAVALQQCEPMILTRRDWSELSILRILGYYLSSYLDFLGLRYISAALERIVMFIYPTLVVMLSALFLGKALTRRTALLLLFSYAGVAFAVVPDLRFAAGNTALGAALYLGSALSFAIYLMRNGQTVPRLGSTRVTAYATGSPACCAYGNSPRCGRSRRSSSPGRSMPWPWPWPYSQRCCPSGWSPKPSGASVPRPHR